MLKSTPLADREIRARNGFCPVIIQIDIIFMYNTMQKVIIKFVYNV